MPRKSSSRFVSGMDCADPESENDVHIRILIATLPLILPGIEISTSGLTHAQAPQSTSRDVNPKESAMQSWLASAGLGDQFDVIRVGTGPHPDDVKLVSETCQCNHGLLR